MTPTLSVIAGDQSAGGFRDVVLDSNNGATIGRSTEADVLVDDVHVSRRHLLIEPQGDSWRIRDVSANGTWYEGSRISGDGILVPASGTVRLRLGDPHGPEIVLRHQPQWSEPARVHSQVSHVAAQHLTVLPARPAWEQDLGRQQPVPQAARLEHKEGHAHPLMPGRMVIGRDPGCDIQLPDLLVSRAHAELRLGTDTAEIVDLGSGNGTFVNGNRVTHAKIYESDVITIGHYLLQVEGNSLVEFVDTGDVSFEAQGLSVYAGDKQLMHDVNFRLPARSLLAVVGPSGAGKSTLLNALTGFRPADEGTVRYAGRDLYSEYDELRRRIGYVPQEDLLHTSLTVRKALEYGAELRFPPDVSEAERAARVDEVLRELGLTNHADTQVGRLSGGQRKRTSVALELLNKPSLLYLDEPTSGLDPGLDKSVMHSLRELADDGRTVVVVTHSVANLDVCDLVLMLAPGGYVAYLGPPRGALAYFGQSDFADVFLSLEATPGEVWGQRFRDSNMYRAAAVGVPLPKQHKELPSVRQQSIARQLSTLVRRYLRVVVSDKSYIRLLIAFPLLLGAIPRVVPAPHGLRAVKLMPNQDAPTVLTVLILCACFMGMANSVREIVKERPIYRRERAIGLSITAYLGSKVIVLTLLTAPQALVFTLIGVLGRTPSKGALGPPLFDIVLAVIVTALASVMLGLVVSTLVNTADKTMPLLVLITMGQLVVSGGLIPIAGKAGFEQVSWFFPARWGYAAVGSSIDLNTVLRTRDKHFKTGPPDPLWNYTASTFLTDVVVALIIGVVAILICGALVRRGDPKTTRRPAVAGAVH